MNLIARNKPLQTLTHEPLLAASTHTPTHTLQILPRLPRYILFASSLCGRPTLISILIYYINKQTVRVLVRVCVCVPARHLFKFICFYFHIWLLNTQTNWERVRPPLLPL